MRLVFEGVGGKSILWRTVNLKAIEPFLVLQPKARNWYTSAKWLPNFVELLLENSQIHSLFYSSWQIFSFFCTTKFLYLKAHISVVYLKNIIFPMKTAAALPKIWWSNCSAYGYGEIEYYYEYCHPKANKKGEKNREPKKPTLYNPLFFTDAQIVMGHSFRSPVQIFHSK